MKRIYLHTICTLILTMLAIQTMAFSENDAKNIAKSFYSNLNKMMDIINLERCQTDETISLQNSITNLCSDNDICMPNEIGLFNQDFTNQSFVPLLPYITQMTNCAIKQKVAFDVTIDKVEALEEAKAFKKEDSKNFYEVYVTKKVKFGSLAKQYHDIVRIHSLTSKIVSIENELGGGQGESIFAIRSRAAKMYSQKRYYEAYNEYLKAFDLNPKDGDTNYRLALMTYFKQGCKDKYRSSERKKKILFYLENAEKYADWKTKDNAKNFHYYLTNGGV
ncbi:MAG: hypothetical protein J5529_04860 [Prevotella sp.]|nr:hypothetical protein [Prevotella sp.]